jgi:hypothetical protein
VEGLSEQEFESGLQNSDLMFYFGHGENLIRGHTIRETWILRSLLYNRIVG